MHHPYVRFHLSLIRKHDTEFGSTSTVQTEALISPLSNTPRKASVAGRKEGRKEGNERDEGVRGPEGGTKGGRVFDLRISSLHKSL